MGTNISTEAPDGTTILAGLARASGYEPENTGYGSSFDLMFPKIMSDWETLQPDEFESLYGTLALHAGLDLEATIEYVLSITRNKNP